MSNQRAEGQTNMSISLGEDILEYLTTRAAELGITRSELIRDLVEEDIAARMKAEKNKRAGYPTPTAKRKISEEIAKSAIEALNKYC